MQLYMQLMNGDLFYRYFGLSRDLYSHKIMNLWVNALDEEVVDIIEIQSRSQFPNFRTGKLQILEQKFGNKWGSMSQWIPHP
jgi:hypothetical protein